MAAASPKLTKKSPSVCIRNSTGYYWHRNAITSASSKHSLHDEDRGHHKRHSTPWTPSVWAPGQSSHAQPGRRKKTPNSAAWLNSESALSDTLMFCYHWSVSNFYYLTCLCVQCDPSSNTLDTFLHPEELSCIPLFQSCIYTFKKHLIWFISLYHWSLSCHVVFLTYLFIEICTKSEDDTACSWIPVNGHLLFLTSVLLHSLCYLPPYGTAYLWWLREFWVESVLCADIWLLHT